MQQSEMVPASYVSEIFTFLAKEIQFSDEMLSILDEERDALKGMDMKALQTVSEKKIKHINRMQQLDSFLQEQVEKCLQAAGYSDKKVAGTLPRKEMHQTIKLSALVERLAGSQRDKMLYFRQTISGKRQEINDKNYINKRLTEDSLGYLNDAVSLITGAIAESYYGQKGEFRNSHSSPALISRAV